MADLLLYQLPSLSLGFIIGLLIKILISSVTLYLSVKLIGGYADFKKSILFSAIMDTLNLVVFPIFPSFFGIIISAILTIFLGIILWFILIMNFFKLSFWKAILVAIVQVVVGIVLAILGLLVLIGAVVGAFLVLT